LSTNAPERRLLVTNEYRTQRNVLLTILAAVAAIGLGFLIGKSGGRGDAADGTPYEVGAAPTATAPADAPAESTATPTSPAATPPRIPVVPPVSIEAPATVRPAPGARPNAPRVTTVTVPAGTRIELALESGVSSQTAGVGDPVLAQVTETIYVDGKAAIPAGSLAAGSVTEARPLRQIGGRGLLAVSFDHLEVPGDEASISAGWRREGKSETAKDAATIAAGAAVGTVVGNQAKKNDKGKVLGGILGGAIGTVIAAKTEGEPVELAAGSHLTLTLRDPVEIRVRG
jgi:hypothetical protein